MEIVWSIAIQNFVLVCTSIVLITMAIQRFKQHPRISTYTILVVACAFSLAVFDIIERIAKLQGILPLAMICAVYGYIARPLCLFFLIMMTERSFKTKYLWLILLPLAIDTVVYLLAFIPGMKTVIFGFARASNGELTFVAGGPLRFTAHVVSGFYLLYLLIAAIHSLRSKHLSHSLALISCTVFITIAVIIETFFDNDNRIEVLNSTIAVSTLTYYLFIYIEKGSVDTLTGLFNRETYYRDIKDMQNTVRGIILFDMNSLKYINDERGYEEGDKALVTIGETITRFTPSNMYAYRLGGDEFIILSNTCLEEELLYIIKRFRSTIEKYNFSCSIGYSYSNNSNRSYQEMLIEAEKRMYKEKEEYYQNTDTSK